MPIIHEIKQEIDRYAAKNSPLDQVRRKYLKEVYKVNGGRPVVLYASCHAIKPSYGEGSAINMADIQSFMVALKGLKGDSLDIVLHSGGGVPDATEQIVNYVRGKFSDVRVIIPMSAMSAATMLSCAADRIVMGHHSALGPIDPQVSVPFSGGIKSVPAQSIIDEFEEARKDLQSGGDPAFWANRLRFYPPGIVQDCRNYLVLSENSVTGWLKHYMLRSQPNSAAMAKSIAKWLADSTLHNWHRRPIGIVEARSKGLLVDALEDDDDLQEAVLSLFHATVITFQQSLLVKIVENHNGKGSYTIEQIPRKGAGGGHP